MGAAVPIIGAVVGTASTISQISAQQKQAAAQATAISAQQKATIANTNLRLTDLERQKQYAQHLATIDTARRAQLKMQDDAELQVAQLKDDLQSRLATAQNEAQYGIANQQNEGMLRQSQLQSENVQKIGNAQLDSQYQQAQGLSNIETLGAQSALDLGYQGALGQADIGLAGDRLQSLSLDRAGIEAQFGKESEAFGVESQALGQGTRTLLDVVSAFTQQKKQSKKGARDRALAQAQLSALGGGAGSRSQGAILEADFDTELDDFVSTILGGGRAADLAMSQVGLSGEQADILRNLGDVLGRNFSSQAEGQRGVAGAQANLAKTGAGNQYSTQSNLNAFQKSIKDIGTREEYVLQQLAIADQAKLEGITNQGQYTLNKLGMESVLSNNRMNIGDSKQLNAIGFDAYKSARDVQFGIEHAQTELQKQFYDTALSSASATIKTSAAGELASLRASRDSISSPGLLSYLGAGLSGFQAISGALPQRQQQPQQQYGGTATNNTTNFTSGSTMGGQFSTANNYGVISGYKLGGGF